MSLTVDQHFALQSLRQGNRAAVLPLVQDVEWMKKAPHHLRTELLRDAEVLSAALPHLPMNMFTGMLWKLPNECRLLVARQFSRAPVFQKLAREDDLSDELFDLLLSKGRPTALSGLWHTVEYSRAYSSEQKLRLYLRLMERYQFVPARPAKDWGPSEMAVVFSSATSILSQLRGHPTLWAETQWRGGLATLWAAAEVAEVVDPKVRKQWKDATSRAYGPVDAVASDLNDVDAVLHLHDPKLADKLPLEAFLRWRDTAGLLRTGESIPDVVEVADLAFSPHAGQLLSQCTDGALATAVCKGVPAEKVLPHVRDVTDFLLGVSHSPWMVQVPLDMLWQGRPALAYRMAAQARSSDAAAALADQVHKKLGDNADAWRFFWESFATWSGSLEDLVETSVAVGQ